MQFDNASFPSRLKTLSPDQLDWIDARVKRFEQEWRSNVETDFQVYLIDAGPLRTLLLAELAQADIEFNHRSGRPSPLERILSQFQELARDSGAVAELLWAEFLFRKREDPQLTINVLYDLFPKLCSQLSAKFGENSISILKSAAAEAAERDTGPTNTPLSIPGFEIREMLGRGGAGVVYRALDLQLNRNVAIKLLLNGSLASVEEQARFRREAATVAALQHPQIVQVFQVGIHAGQPYLVLEYASNGNLSKKLAGQPLDSRRAAEIMVGIARATDAIHCCGILHRDLKPSNVLVTDEGTLKIADFGLAKLMSAELSHSLGDSIVGTPSYSAPEYVFGSSKCMGPTLDIYSLGAVFYELLTGRAPFVGASVYEILVQLKQGNYLPPRELVSGIPRDLENICTKCLDRSPESRYVTAAELADDLERFLEGRSVRARPLPWPLRSWRWVRRNPWIVASAASLFALMLLVVLGSVVFVVLQSRSMKVESDLRTNADRSRNEAIRNEQRALTDAATANEAVQIIEKLFDSSILGLSSNGYSQSAPARYSIDMSAREMVDRSITLLRDSPLEQPMVRARLLTAVGTSALNIGMVKEARPLIIESISLYEKLDAQESLAAANTYLTLARIEAEQWNIDAAQAMFEKTESILKALDAEKSILWADTVIYHARMGVSMHQRQYASAILPSLERAFEMKSQLLGQRNTHSIIAETILIMCRALALQDAETSVVELERILTEIQVTPIHPYFEALVLDALASIHQRLNHSDQATKYVTQSLVLMQRAIGDTSHPDLSMVYADAAWIAHCRGDELSFRVYQSDAIAMRRQILGWDNNTLNLVSELLAGLESATELRELRRWLDLIEGENPNIELSFRTLGYYLSRIRDMESEGDYAKAMLLVDKATALFDATSSTWVPLRERLAVSRAWLQIMTGDCDNAMREYRSWVANRTSPPEVFGRRKSILSEWSKILALIGQGDLSEADSLFSESINAPLDGMPVTFHQDDWHSIVEFFHRVAKQPIGRSRLEQWHEDWLRNRSSEHVCMGGLKTALAERCLEDGELGRASQFANDGFQLLRKLLGDRAGPTIDAQLMLARIYAEQGKHGEAESLARDAVVLAVSACGDHHPRTWSVRRQLARILYIIDRRDEAVAIAMESVVIIRSRLGIHHTDYSESVFLVVELMTTTDDRKAVRQFLSPIVDEFKQSVPAKNSNKLRMEQLLLRD